MVCRCLALEEITRLLSKVVAQLYMPTKDERVPIAPQPHQRLLFIFVNVAVPTDVSHCGFIHTSLINDSEHFCLLCSYTFVRLPW